MEKLDERKSRNGEISGKEGQRKRIYILKDKLNKTETERGGVIEE